MTEQLMERYLDSGLAVVILGIIIVGLFKGARWVAGFLGEWAPKFHSTLSTQAKAIEKAAEHAQESLEQGRSTEMAIRALARETDTQASAIGELKEGVEGIQTELSAIGSGVRKVIEKLGASDD